MQLKYTYVLAQLGDEYAAVPIDDASQQQHRVVYLNKTGIVIWQGIMDGLDEDGISNRVAEQFKADLSVARKGVHKVIMQLQESGLLMP